MIHFEGECRSLKRVPKGSHVTMINGRKVIGICDICDHYILQGVDYETWKVNSIEAKTHDRCILRITPKRFRP